MGLDTARGPSTGASRTAGGWAETLRPLGFGAGDAWRGWRRFGCSLALDGGRSGEGLLSRDGVGCVTAGTGGGVPGLVRAAGGSGCGAKDIIIGAFCSFLGPRASNGPFSESGETGSMGDRGVDLAASQREHELPSDLESSLVLAAPVVAVVMVLVGDARAL